MDNEWTKIPDIQIIEKTIEALKENGIDSFVVENAEEARKKVFEILPKGAEVMTMTSATLEAAGISKEINESGKYKSVRKEFEIVDETEKRHLGAAPDWTIGSVHAITEDGHLLIASGTGSQLPAYVYGANHVIWVVGAQKIVKNFDEGIKRIYEHTLPLESARMMKLHGMGSSVNKLLVINKEGKPNRLTLIVIKEVVGF